MKSQQNNTNVVIVFDAFRGSFAEKLSARLSLRVASRGGVQKITGGIIPPFSFEPDAAFLTGHHPEETNNGTHFWYDPECSSFRGIISRSGIADRLPWSMQLALRKWISWHINPSADAQNVERRISTARIPFRFLHYFDVVQKRMPFKEDFCPFPTIFDLLRSANKHWVYIGSPVSSARSEDVWEALQKAPIEDASLVFLFVGDLDGIGHRYGPDSTEYADALHKISGFLRRVLDYVQRRTEVMRALIFGDHGMVEVTRCVDVQAALERLPVRPVEDYLYFLDSTMARFWFFNERARQAVTEAMQALEGGRLITEEDQATYHIRYPHNRFGELIWWADGGTLILPNFWQGKKPVKGMHGYRREVTDNHAGLLLMDPDLQGTKMLEQPLEMVAIFATMMDMLEIEKPSEADGRSVYEMIA